MARPLRIEFAGALYHVTSRGDGRDDVDVTDADRQVWLELLGQASERFNWLVHADCPMGNHYHLLVETPMANSPRACASSTASTRNASTAPTTGQVMCCFAC